MTNQKTPVHEVATTDTEVRGRPGTVVTCSCGWRTAWAVRDGSAEADAHGHMRANDAEYRERDNERAEQWRNDLIARGCKCELMHFSYVTSPNCTMHNRPRTAPVPVKEHSHNCSCHLSAPCGPCENCKHFDNHDCSNDCQTCEEHDDE